MQQDSDEEQQTYVCDAFVESPLHFNKQLYRMWLNGLSVKEALNERLQTQANDMAFNRFIEATNLSQSERNSLLVCDINQAFYAYSLAERSLSHPSLIHTLPQTFMSWDITDMMVEEYYTIDLTIARELVGKKFHVIHKGRDVEMISERLKVRPVQCRRLLANLKRIYKSVTVTSKSSVKYIQEHFMLSRELSQMYDQLVFFCYHRFDINRKKLDDLTGDEVIEMSKVLMSKWRPKEAQSGGSGGGGGRDQYDIDSKLCDRLRNLKGLLLVERNNLENYNNEVVKQFEKMTSIDGDKLTRIQNQFNSFIKSLLSIGARLNQAKEFDDFFIDLIEKVREPLIKIELSKKEVVVLFRFLIASFDCVVNGLDETDAIDLTDAWTKFLEGITDCVLMIYEGSKH
jgi:hypothetical protein